MSVFFEHCLSVQGVFKCVRLLGRYQFSWSLYGRSQCPTKVSRTINPSQAIRLKEHNHCFLFLCTFVGNAVRQIRTVIHATFDSTKYYAHSSQHTIPDLHWQSKVHGSSRLMVGFVLLGTRWLSNHPSGYPTSATLPDKELGTFPLL